MALFKIFNNFNDLTKTIDTVSNHKAGYCYFDATTNKFYIDTVDNSAAGLRQLNGTFFGECSTVAETANKTASISGFALAKGVVVYIKFLYANTAVNSTLTLNISNTGAKSIKKYGTSDLDANVKIQSGMVCQFLYDGVNWIWVGNSTMVSAEGGSSGTTIGRLIFGNGTYIFDGSEDVTVPLYTGAGTWTGATDENEEEPQEEQNNNAGKITDENEELIFDENGDGIEFDGYDEENTSSNSNISNEDNENVTDENGESIEFDEDENSSSNQSNITNENNESVADESGNVIEFDDDNAEAVSSESNTPITGENNEEITFD